MIIIGHNITEWVGSAILMFFFEEMNKFKRQTNDVFIDILNENYVKYLFRRACVMNKYMKMYISV